MSGTSMASPAVAGTIAMFMGMGDTVEAAMEKVTALATVDAIDRRSTLVKPRSPNLIAYNGLDLGIRKEYVDDDSANGSDDDTESLLNENLSTTEKIYSSLRNLNGRSPANTTDI
ncbi:hypothetical protein AWJ20_4683 [Sugiyamaella lignohabitans]|uniref:Subtilisin n=1 Tax=Sugiyamaella lignohabitans TaxID=796027 RepID=A0A167E7K2_9ASCO|nr:uncharacterized protein AWJ20_4683 [Sugiyamaella lignohabitans]ANB13739.1 hypothetical protein AWJ20_4683 [Sugiyamaella lignohabitans]